MWPLAVPAGSLDEGEKTGYWQADYAVSHWREVEVPAVFERCLTALASYEGTGWFRRAVAVPREWEGKRGVLRFEGVNYHARVWVNGSLIGEHEDGFLPFELAVDSVLRWGDENVVAVRVDNVQREGEAPGRERGWRPYGGVLREVELTAMNPVHVAALQVVAEPDGRDGRLSVATEVASGLDREARVEMRAQVTDRAGAVVCRLSAPGRACGPGESARIELEGVARRASFWSPNQPALYCLAIELRADGRPADARRVRFGFRRIEARDGRLLLNGTPIALRGFNRPEDSPRTDMAPDLELVGRDLQAMKGLGCNFIRLCHYPHHPRELDLCDELGVLAMGEIPLYWWHGLAEGEQECRRTLAAAKRQLSAMIARDRHHPSLIMWSVSNETDELRPEVAEGNAELVRLARQLDPSRPATHVSHHWTGGARFDEDDVISVNAYPSWDHRCWRAEATYPLAESSDWWRRQLAGLHARYPDKPILVTEFGYPALEGVRQNAVGEEVQAEVLRQEFAGMQAPYVCGATIWCWADHPRPEEGFIRQLTTSPFGVVTRSRRPKAALSAARELFGGEPEPAEETSEDILVAMIRADLEDMPEAPFPAGFAIRAMRSGEGALWTDIERDAERLIPITDEVFEQEFGHDLPATTRRCFFVVNEAGVAVGTVSAWYLHGYRGQDWGRLHWLAIRPAYQGLGPGKGALSAALRRMREWHARAWLQTSTSRLGAIKLYLDFGFLPDLAQPRAWEAWQKVRAELAHPALERVLGSPE